MSRAIFLSLQLVVLSSALAAVHAEGACSVVPGPPGRDGRDGLPGKDGAPGKDGTTGKDGLTGRDGAQGRDGTAGRNGIDGAPGTCSYSDIQRIREEVQRELEESLRITANELIQNQTSANAGGQNQATGPALNCSQGLGEINNPAESCQQIYNCQPSSPSGQYWIHPEAGESVVRTYCDLETKLNGVRGWARVAYVNMTEDGAQCPGSLRTVTESQKTICTGVDSDSATCTSVSFPVQGKRYSKICGQALGYQKGSTDGFHGPRDINSHYVDGISITYGSPRKHVWTYAAGLSDDYNYPAYNCPCATTPGPSQPLFVSDHFYCESGNTGTYDVTEFYSADLLWDGQGCGAGNNCCSQPGMPWFCRTLPQEVDEDFEIRLCRNQGSGDERVYLELLEIYIQ